MIITPPSGPWTFSTYTWTGFDGRDWDLLTGVHGLFMNPEVRGLEMPVINRYKGTSPAVHGSWWRGMNVPEREVFWPLEVYSEESSQHWIDTAAAFWKTMNPYKTGTWTVTQPNGTYRYLTLRFSDDGQKAYDISPELVGWTEYGITLVAEDPFWHSKTQTRSFPAVEQNYLMGGQPVSTASPTFAAPPFAPSPSSSTGTLIIPNPGDIEAWPVWVLRGPMTSAVIGVPGKTITVTATLAAGQFITIDSDPRRQTAIDQSGADRIAALSSYNFTEILAGEEAAVIATVNGGAGSIDVSVSPRHFRAF